MSQRPPTIPSTKSDSSSDCLEKPINLIPEHTPIIRALPEAMSEFIQDIFKAKLNHPKGGGHVEADRSVINHYNPGTMIQGFEATGYFVYDGVYVTERGKNTPRVWLGEKVQK